MSDYSLVPVDHQPDFGDVTLVPVDHDPFADGGPIQQAQTQAQPSQAQPAQPQSQSSPGSSFAGFFNQLAAPERAESEGVADLVQNHPTAAKIVGTIGLGSALLPTLAFAGAEALGMYGAGAGGAAAADVLAAPAARVGRGGLAERAKEIHSVLDKVARKLRTTAVLETDAGRIVAGGTRDLSPPQRVALKQGEIAAKAPNLHAEVTALNEAASIGATPSELAVTRTICPECVALIESLGGRLTSRTTAVFPRR